MWAVATRIAGGFGTVSVQLFAPALDAEVSAEVRGGRHQATAKTVRRGVKQGIIISIVACVIADVVAVVARRDSASLSRVLVIGVATILYWGSTLIISPIYKSLTLLEGKVKRVIWDVTRFVLFIAAVLSTSEAALLLTIARITAGTNAFYVFLVFRQIEMKPELVGEQP